MLPSYFSLSSSSPNLGVLFHFFKKDYIQTKQAWKYYGVDAWNINDLWYYTALSNIGINYTIVLIKVDN